MVHHQPGVEDIHLLTDTEDLLQDPSMEHVTRMQQGTEAHMMTMVQHHSLRHQVVVCCSRAQS